MACRFSYPSCTASRQGSTSWKLFSTPWLTKGQQALLADYAALLKAGKMKKIRILIKNRFYKNTLSRTLGQFVSI